MDRGGERLAGCGIDSETKRAAISGHQICEGNGVMTKAAAPLPPAQTHPADAGASTGTVAQPAHDPIELRDLHAQEAMAFWAVWMFVAAAVTIVVTLIGTWMLWRQIKLTRNALEETRRATGAMERQTDLVERAQRPWVAVSVEPKFAGCLKGIMAVEAVAYFHNVGQTAAVAVDTSLELICTNDNYMAVVAERIDAARKVEAPISSAILPNETVERRLDFAKRAETMPFIEDGDHRTIFLVLLATVRYRASSGIPADRLETCRAFLLQRREKTIGRSDAGFILSGFRYDDFAYGSTELELSQIGGERTS